MVITILAGGELTIQTIGACLALHPEGLLSDAVPVGQESCLRVASRSSGKILSTVGLAKVFFATRTCHWAFAECPALLWQCHAKYRYTM